MTEKLTATDYPLAEKRPDLVKGERGKPLDALTLEAVMAGDVEMQDLRITPEALLRQAQIARSVGRSALAANLERAAEMTAIPESEVMEIYELLRPGRAASKQVLTLMADQVRDRYQAHLLADFLDQAADFYERRGLFRKRY